MKNSKFASSLKALTAMTLFIAGAQAIAQPPPEEITVTGRYGRVPDNVQSLSQAVSYADLDLSLRAEAIEIMRDIDRATIDGR